MPATLLAPPPNAPPAGAIVVRQAERDLARQFRRAEQIPPELRERFRAFALERAKAQGWLWRDGLEPLPFDDFSVALDGTRLTPRQHWVFASSGCLRAADLFSPSRKVQEFVLCWGKGSGKGWLSARFIAWTAYVLASIAPGIDPAAFLGLAPRSPLVAMNVAPDQHLARTVFFKYLRANMRHPLLKQFEPDVLADEVRFWRPDPFGGKYEFLSLYSKHSNASGIDGHNLVAFVGDEVDAFPNTESEDTAKELHDILRSSASTRVGERWIGFMISYPRTQDGFLMQLLGRAQEDHRKHGPENSSYFWDLAATWDVRPGVTKETVKTIQEDYDYDPRGAMAKYECVPLSVDEAFFEVPERVDQAVDPDRKPVAIWRQTISVGTGHNGEEQEMVSALIESVTPEPGRNYFLGGDGGISGDLFSLSVWSTDNSGGSPEYLCPGCVAEMPSLLSSARYQRQLEGAHVYVEAADVHAERVPSCGACGDRPPLRVEAGGMRVRFNLVDWWVQAGEDAAAAMLSVKGEMVVVPRVAEDLIVTFRPRYKTRPDMLNRTVDLEGVEEVCRQLIRRLNIRKARFDPYQLVGMAQKLSGFNGCDVQTIGFGNADQYRRALLVKALLNSNFLKLLPHRMPRPEEEALTSDQHTGEDRRGLEWKRLQRKGTRIDHPKRGSKDIWDAEAVAIWTAITDQCERIELDWVG